MPGSNYLDGAENSFGLPATLPVGVAEQASAIVDSYTRRPEGLVYVTDTNGNPIYMKALTPTMTYTVAASVSPGQNVVVNVSPASVRSDMVGQVLIYDRASNDISEAVLVTAVSGNSQLTLANVQFNHGAAGKLDLGMVISEERNIPSKRSVVRYSRFPCASILSLMGRYTYGRRSDQIRGTAQTFNLLAAASVFGGPPSWIPINIPDASWNDETGEIWVPAGMLLAYYSEVMIRYVCGYPTAPHPIVKATASIAQSLIQGNAYGGGNVKSFSAGDSRIEKFGATNIDDDTRRVLEAYRPRTFF